MKWRGVELVLFLRFLLSLFLFFYFLFFYFYKDLFCHWTCWWIRKDRTSRWLPFWEYFKRWQGSHKQSYLQSLKLVIHVCCWVLTLMYNVFAVKAHLLVYNSFVEDIFILNDCHAMKRRCISRFGFKCGCRCGTWQFLKKVEFRCSN